MAIKVGLLGYGLAGSVFHAPLIAATPGLQLVAVASSRTEKIAAELPGVEATTAQAVIARPDIDLIVVATPNPLHFPQARDALLAGKHVVVDKPMALDSAEADCLIALAQQQDRMLSVFHNRRWDGGFLTLRQLIDQGRLGRVQRYEARYDRYRPAIKPGWREVGGPGSGILADLGAHLVDQALVLFGRPDRVAADIVTQRSGAVVEDYFEVRLEFGDRRAVLGSSTLAPMPGPSLIVHGDQGSFIKSGLDPQEAALKAGLRPGDAGFGHDDPAAYGRFGDGADGHVIATLAGNYPAYYRGILAAIRDRVAPPVLAEEARDVLRILELARQSAAEGRVVAFSACSSPGYRQAGP